MGAFLVGGKPEQRRSMDYPLNDVTKVNTVSSLCSIKTFSDDDDNDDDNVNINNEY